MKIFIACRNNLGTLLRPANKRVAVDKSSKICVTLYILLFLLFATSVFAETQHMKLLAVSERDGILNGSIADLYLDIIPGNGGVFLETFPLTRLDTQISTRFAKTIACEIADKDCSKYNFIYAIKAESAIIGGPSAGAALALLTAGALTNTPLHKHIAITGTINSGGLIGPVSGIPEKIDAAATAGITIVLIPKGTRYYKQPEQFTTNATVHNKTVNITIVKATNKTMDLIAYGAQYNISVKEVSDLNSAFYAFAGRYLYHNTKNITKETGYTTIMEEVAIALCDRAENLKDLIPRSINSSFVQQANELLDRATKSRERFDFYSQASFCFAANTKLQTQNMIFQNLSSAHLNETLLKVAADKQGLREKVENFSLKTITDIQAYMIVHERLRETEEAATLAAKLIQENDKAGVDQLAYTIERLQSARSWMKFLGSPGKTMKIDHTTIRNACVNKLEEARERYQYVRTVYPFPLPVTEKTLERAEDDANDEKYLLCLHKASKAKAEADVVLNTMGVSDEYLEGYVRNRLDLVKEAIVHAQEKGLFPILGYSYWEYASALLSYDRASALLFSEYAQELAHVNLYFEEKKPEKKKMQIPYQKEMLIFIGGIVAGMVFMVFLRKMRRWKKR